MAEYYEKKKNWTIWVSENSTIQSKHQHKIRSTIKLIETNKPDNPTINTDNYQPKVPKPPPISIYGATNFYEIVDYLASVVVEE